MNQRLLGIIPLLLCAACATQKPKPDPELTSAVKPSAEQPAQAAAAQESARPAEASMAPAARSIYFGFDNILVDDRYREMIMAHSNYLLTHPAAEMKIQGNTDERGGREYNLALGNRRAREVRRLMTLLGAAPRQIDAVSFGKERPAAPCHNESCWEKNRRADIVYQGEN